MVHIKAQEEVLLIYKHIKLVGSPIVSKYGNAVKSRKQVYAII